MAQATTSAAYAAAKVPFFTVRLAISRV